MPISGVTSQPTTQQTNTASTPAATPSSASKPAQPTGLDAATLQSVGETAQKMMENGTFVGNQPEGYNSSVQSALQTQMDSAHSANPNASSKDIKNSLADAYASALSDTANPLLSNLHKNDNPLEIRNLLNQNAKPSDAPQAKPNTDGTRGTF